MWSVWSDPNNWSRWNSGIRSATINGPLVSGATGMMKTNCGSKHAVTFADVEPPRHFTMTMSGPPLTVVVHLRDHAERRKEHDSAEGCDLRAARVHLRADDGPMMASHFVPVLDDLAGAAEAAP